MTPSEDPGWGPALRRVIPFYGLTARPAQQGQGLTATRILYLGVAAAIPLYWVLFSFIAPWDAGDDGIGPYLVVVVGIASIAVTSRLMRWNLDPSTPEALAASFRRRMYLAIATAEVASLFSIAASFVVSNSLWIMGVGAIFSLVGLWIAAPSKRNLATDQERLRERGSSLDLVAVLNAQLQPPQAGSK